MKKIILLVLMVISLSTSQAEPQDLLNVVVTAPPGSATDVQARTWVKKYDETFGTASRVTNKTGGDGVIGIRYFLSLNNSYGIPLLWPSTGHILAYNAADRSQIEPLFEGSRVPFVFIVRKDLPVNSWREWIEYNRAHPGQVNQGHGGTAWQGMVDYINIKNKINPTTVYYSGTQRVEIDTASGVLDGSWQLPWIIGSGIESRVKIIGITSNVPNEYNIPLLGTDPTIGQWYLHQGFYIQSDTNAYTKQLVFDRFKFLRNLPWAKETIARNGVVLADGSSKDFANNINQLSSRLRLPIKQVKAK